MTAPTDTHTAGAVLHAALPVRAQIHITRTRKFDHDAAQAFARGWTVDVLADRISSGQLGDNPGGVITSRLEDCGRTDPPKEKQRGIPFCSPDCAERRGWLEDDDGNIVGRCPCRTRPPEAN